MAPTPQAVAEMAARYAAAWSAHVPADVAGFYARDGHITINDGDPVVGRAALTGMVAGFYAEFPDIVVHMDLVRTAGTHAIFAWTLEGTHAQTRNAVRVSGWEAWTLNDDCEIAASRGHFDADEYERQIAEGI
ncbi:nuclear transport factor 2 family protein [Limibaculum sp. M0105]|uniref:Nuclear transport factor 2 family protein n=1 Tax=Thermohalobaculum xanthum TaxID=2753746 RepID=A0A8J7SGL3_9RHOB|nr:nuclear transport factor 2 family protein [Thermohalobaculum xanthum]MBK0400242.1 nuclear transport factor 2 family protein [Thermohalobaculum xanthum]